MFDRYPFLKVLALFFVEGVVLWLMSLFEERMPTPVAAIWLGAFGCVVAWWSIWPALAAERGWQPWLEWLALAGACYWLPMLLDPWVRAEERTFIPMSAVLYLLIGLGVLLSGLAAIAYLLVAKLAIGWRLESPRPTGPFGLRGMFLMVLLVSGHLAAFVAPLREASERTFKFSDVLGVGAVLLFMLPVIAVVLGGGGIVLSRKPLISMSFAGGGVLLLLGFCFVTGANEFRSILPIVALLVSATLQGFALRWLGYRITSRGERRFADMPFAADRTRSCLPACRAAPAIRRHALRGRPHRK
jgi:hypothetical protein